MAEKLDRRHIAAVATIHAAPPAVAPAVAQAVTVDRSFELPPALYAATVGLYLGFIAVMGLGFANPEMILPVAIFVLFITAGFGVPTIWVRLAPDSGQAPLSWSRFQAEGIRTLSGRLDAGAATVQVLILPALIFLWGVVTVTIAALVR